MTKQLYEVIVVLEVDTDKTVNNHHGYTDWSSDLAQVAVYEAVDTWIRDECCLDGVSIGMVFSRDYTVLQ